MTARIVKPWLNNVSFISVAIRTVGPRLLSDPRMIGDFFEEYAKFLDEPFPAMNLVIAGLAQDCMVLEIEAIG